MTEEGRIIDGAQKSDSHSEGQGYGLALAALFGDFEGFERIHRWTEKNLAVRSDNLLAWRWSASARPNVMDMNNASDGDLFYAWALASMGRLTGRGELIERARAIAIDLARICMVPHPDGSDTIIMLPAEKGFEIENGYVFNPSYIMPRAMMELASATGVSDIAEAARSGVDIMHALASNGLVPDWVAITTDGLAPPPERFSFNAGYEAVRVPLFAVWSGLGASLPVQRYRSVVEAAAGLSGSVTVFERSTGRPMEVSPDPGYLAVSGLVTCAATRSVGAPIPAFSTAQPYYPATLQLMSLVAHMELYPSCVPL